MSKMVQIRNVSDALHRKLKVRAADAGQTLSDYTVIPIWISLTRAWKLRENITERPA